SAIAASGAAAASGAPAASGPSGAIGKLRSAADAKQGGGGADALLEVIATDASALKGRETTAAAAAIVTGVGATGERADKVFGALSKDAGETGLDILYVVSGDDGKEPTTEPAKRALEAL